MASSEGQEGQFGLTVVLLRGNRGQKEHPLQIGGMSSNLCGAMVKRRYLWLLEVMRDICSRRRCRDGKDSNERRIEKD